MFALYMCVCVCITRCACGVHVKACPLRDRIAIGECERDARLLFLETWQVQVRDTIHLMTCYVLFYFCCVICQMWRRLCLSLSRSLYSPLLARKMREFVAFFSHLILISLHCTHTHTIALLLTRKHFVGQSLWDLWVTLCSVTGLTFSIWLSRSGGVAGGDGNSNVSISIVCVYFFIKLCLL